MNLSDITPTQMAIAVAVIAGLVVAISLLIYARKRRTQRLIEQFGAPEYDRVMMDEGNREKAETALGRRADRVESLNIRQLSPADRARFIESWRTVQARFVDGPGGAVAEADQLLGDVMSTRGYPVSNFEQRAADISVHHPLVLQNYRAAHEIAIRQTHGQASTEELRQAMIHYRTLFDDLIAEPELARAKAAGS
jgi:hypothetical protein